MSPTFGRVPYGPTKHKKSVPGQEDPGSKKTQEKPKSPPRVSQTAPKRRQNWLQQAPERPLTINIPTNIQDASDALSNNRHRACWTGTVAGFDAGSWIN